MVKRDIFSNSLALLACAGAIMETTSARRSSSRRSSSTSSSSRSSGSISGDGWIIAVIIIGVLMVLTTVAVLYFKWKRRRGNQSVGNASSGMNILHQSNSNRELEEIQAVKEQDTDPHEIEKSKGLINDKEKLADNSGA